MLGETLALGSALVWAVSVILFKRSEAIAPFGLNLFKNLSSLVLLVPTLLLFGIGIDLDRAPGDWVRLATSGLLGIAIADTLFFAALRRLGPGRLAVVHCLYAPLITALAVLVLGERPGAGFGLGAVLVLGGILLVTTERRGAGPGAGQRVSAAGVLYGMLDVSAMALGVIIAKPALERSPLLEVTLVRLAAGIGGLLVWLAVVPARRAELAVLRPQPVWRTLVPASILGTYLSMILWLGGFKWADAATASVLNQTSVVFQIVLGRVVLGEVLSGRRAAGAALAIGGALLVLLW